MYDFEKPRYLEKKPGSSDEPHFCSEKPGFAEAIVSSKNLVFHRGAGIIC